MNCRLTTMTAVVALMLFAPIAGYPQDKPPTPPGAAQAIPPAPPGTVAPSAVDTKSNTYTQQKLDQMLAPIALYPDQLVSQILMLRPFRCRSSRRCAGSIIRATPRSRATRSSRPAADELGPERQVDHGVPGDVKMLNKKSRLDQFARVAFGQSTERCHGANPVLAPPGTEGGQSQIERQDRVSRRRAQHHDCAGRCERHVCSLLQPGRRLW